MFTNLHVHSHYSTLDGLGTIDEIVKRAKETGAPAVCVTDHASIACLPDLMAKANEAGLLPIPGCEFYVVEREDCAEKGEKRYHLTVLPKNWRGVQSIMSQLTRANQQFYKRPRLSFDQCLEFNDCILLSGCVMGFLAHPAYKMLYGKFKAAYGDDLYLEIMPHAIWENGPVSTDLQRVVNERALELWQEDGAKLIATNDAHYVWQKDAYAHEVLLAIQTRSAWDDPKRWKFPGDCFYMRDLAQMIDAFGKICPYLPPEAVKQALVNTAAIVRRINVELPKFPVELPSPYCSNDDQDGDMAIFAKKLQDGWARKIAGKVDNLAEYGKRLTHEIGVVKRLGFTRYFLIVEDIIRWSRENGIMVGPARGSSAGSLICYLLDITQLDPIKHELYFERFLNEERLDFPDIDVDFMDSRRQEVFEYIRRKYGFDNTAQINTFGYITLKVAFKDCCRVFGVNNLAATAMGKLLETEEDLENVPELKKFADTEAGKNIVALAKKLTGRIRQNGVHAAGIVVSSKPLTNAAVIERRGEGAEVINWDKRQCEQFGLIKIDILGLSTLTILDRAAKSIKEIHGKDIDFVGIPMDDPKVMEAFASGNTTGVFQFENSGMKGLLKNLEAKDFETITATTALFRPGPLNSGITDMFVSIAKGHEYERYPHPALKPILSATRSMMIYQEQVMRIANELAGFTWNEADKLRKIIGKKLGPEEFEKHRGHFVEGCVSNGVDEKTANDIFSQMVEFAGYGFNRSHAAAYALISLWAQYIKTYYPVEFMAASLTVMDEDKKRLPLMQECKRLGITVRPPDVNQSGDGYTIRSGQIIAPLNIIKGVGDKAIASILSARAKGPFASLEDLQSRVERRLVHKGVVATLIRSGAFESLGHIEEEEERRIKNYSELMPSFSMIPSLALDRRLIKEEVEMIGKVLGAAKACQAIVRPKSIVFEPRFKTKSGIMVVNNPVKNELEHFRSDGSRHFLKTMKSLGFTEGDFYYTAPVKCSHDNYQKVEASCLSRCLEILAEEIRIVRPKLIICFANSAVPFLSGDNKAQASKLRGQVIYNKAFDTYVLFSLSPQYAFFNEDAQSSFMEAMSLVKGIFS